MIIPPERVNEEKINGTGTSQHPTKSRRRNFLAAVVLLLRVAGAAMVPGGSLANREIAAPRLSSGASGVLTVVSDTPSPTPEDYRVAWAPENGEWLSYWHNKGTERGNLNPGGSETSFTISGLTPGAVYKVMVRARYEDEDPGLERGGHAPGPRQLAGRAHRALSGRRVRQRHTLLDGPAGLDYHGLPCLARSQRGRPGRPGDGHQLRRRHAGLHSTRPRFGII